MTDRKQLQELGKTRTNTHIGFRTPDPDFWFWLASKRGYLSLSEMLRDLLRELKEKKFKKLAKKFRQESKNDE